MPAEVGHHQLLVARKPCGLVLQESHQSEVWRIMSAASAETEAAASAKAEETASEVTAAKEAVEAEAEAATAVVAAAVAAATRIADAEGTTALAEATEIKHRKENAAFVLRHIAVLEEAVVDTRATFQRKILHPPRLLLRSLFHCRDGGGYIPVQHIHLILSYTQQIPLDVL